MTGKKCCCSVSDRRGFLKKAAAAVLGAIATLIPVGAGLTVWLDPLRRKSDIRAAVLVANLSALPEDGLPRKFPVISSRVDAWNKSAAAVIGAVYLRREKGRPVEALNVVCPHAGCFVDFIATRHCFLCPCHNSTFALDGQVSNRESPAPRGLDSLEAEVRKGGEIWVKFQNYRSGVSDKIST